MYSCKTNRSECHGKKLHALHGQSVEIVVTDKKTRVLAPRINDMFHVEHNDD